jgi:hypothetical protein
VKRAAQAAGWALGAPAIEMLDAADADERADDDRESQARLRAMAAALGILRAAPPQM